MVQIKMVAIYLRLYINQEKKFGANNCTKQNKLLCSITILENEMSNKNNNCVHWTFWAISIFMLIWNVMGCINFIVQMNPEMIASYRETEQAIIKGRPIWATIGFAVGVFGGALGCIFLILKKVSALYLFIISLVGVVVAVSHSLTGNVMFELGEMVGVIIMPITTAVFLIWYSNYSKNKYWLSAT